MRALEDKVALITGAGSGLGAAAARLLASEGAKVGLFSRTEEELVSLQREIANEGGTALALRGDVSRSSDLENAVEQMREAWDRLDVLFVNAGINGVWAPIELLALHEWEETLSTNLTGTFLTVKAALPLLKVRGGSVIITSSVNGTRMFSNSGATAYACSKAGQVAFAKMTAVEFARHRIRVNVICPGYIATAMQTEKRDTEGLHRPVEFPEGPIPLTGMTPGRAEQVAELVLFLACEKSDHITGTEIYIDGGQSLLQG